MHIQPLRGPNCWPTYGPSHWPNEGSPKWPLKGPTSLPLLAPNWLYLMAHWRHAHPATAGPQLLAPQRANKSSSISPQKGCTYWFTEGTHIQPLRAAVGLIKAQTTGSMRAALTGALKSWISSSIATIAKPRWLTASRPSQKKLVRAQWILYYNDSHCTASTSKSTEVCWDNDSQH